VDDSSRQATVRRGKLPQLHGLDDAQFEFLGSRPKRAGLVDTAHSPGWIDLDGQLQLADKCAAVY
jgi:hypothetical protein